MNKVVRFAPAKINLFLAITGRRADGFHELVSVVAPLDWGDRLTLETAGDTSLECADPDVPRDEKNLVLQAASLFAAETGWSGGIRFLLEKTIPIGAGLGGGSSDGAAALTGLNELAGYPLSAEKLKVVAGKLGSDCALFLAGVPVVMRGRGDLVEALPESAAARIRGKRVLVFKPEFGVATRWAYAELARDPEGSYLPAAVAEARLRGWIERPNAPLDALLLNTMERAAFRKFLALPALLQQLRDAFGLSARMSGSGSACFALVPDSAPMAEITAFIRQSWGPSAFVREARFA